MTKWVMGSSCLALLLLLVPVLGGCGATEEEMAGKDRAIAVLNADLRNTRTKLADDEARLGEVQTETTRMRDQLKQAGLSPDRVGEGAKFQQAVVEYKLRTEQLAMFEMRVKDLRAKLEKGSAGTAGKAGVRVVVRNNRLVIAIPSDLLFDAGRDDLRQPGKEALTQIVEVLRSDRELGNRTFVAAAHTDNNKATRGGPFKDNVGLSLARARQVMLQVTGAGLNPLHWSAAGYGEFDPVAGSVDQQTKEEQTKNRRVELVLEPSADEGLNVGSAK